MKLIKTITILIIGFFLATGATIYAARTTPALFDQDSTTISVQEITYNLAIGTTTATTKFNVVGTSTMSSIYPYADSTYYLGADTLRWKSAYIDALHSETITIDGTSAGDLDMSNNLVLNIGTSTTDFTTGGGLNLKGILAVDTSDFYVDTANSKIGIGTTSPSQSLTVGDANQFTVTSAGAIDGTSLTIDTPLAITQGGTGTTTAANARVALGLEIGVDIQAYDDGLLSIAGLVTDANEMIYTTALDAYATTSLTVFARTILDDAAASNVRTTLELDSMALLANTGSTTITTLGTITTGVWESTETGTDSWFLSELGVGTSTISGDLHIWDTASSTVYIGDATHSGCLVIGDSDNAGISYITILDGTITATSTKPNICK